MLSFSVAAARNESRVFSCFFAAFATVMLGWPSAPSVAATVRNAEDLLIVDCLLPGQVRKLGRQASFLSARRPIRTTQADCEIRGGEFVSYDRANYQTALKVWMGQAESGDAEAQNYVGEIYLKGLGTAPDYAQAASWFEKAVAQGDKRAMINLGYIHEEGLGRPRDLTGALNLYRKASGADDELLFASTVTVQAEQAKAEIATLKQTVEQQQAEASNLRAQIDDLKRQVSERRRALSANEKELDRVRTELVAKQATLIPPAQGLALRQLQVSLDARVGDLTVQRSALERDRAGMVEQVQSSQIKLADLRSKEVELATREKDDEASRQELARIRSAATDLALTLDDTFGKMSAMQQQLDANNAKLVEQQAQFDAERKKMQASVAGSQQDRDLLILLEQQLAAKQREVGRQREQIVSLERQIGAPTSSMTLASLGAVPGPSLEIIDPPLSLTRGKPAAMVRSSVGSSEVLGKVTAQAGLKALEVNGKTVAVASNGLFRVNVPVATEGSTISMTAIDRTGTRTALEFALLPMAGKAPASTTSGASSVRPTPRGLKLGKFHALVVGNDSYANYARLGSAVSDARKVADVLKRRYGFETRVLTDATRYDILSALNDMREGLQAQDNLLVYFAGHGEIDARTKQGYWVPVDGRQNDPGTWISNRAISDILNTMQSRHVMVVADSCYSGAMTRASVPAFNAAMSDAQWGEWVRGMSGSRSRTALTSGGLAPVPDAGAGGNSMFAQAFVNALQDNRQLLEGQRLFREISLSMAMASLETSLPQSPEYAPIQFAGHEAGEFIFQPRG